MPSIKRASAIHAEGEGIATILLHGGPGIPDYFPTLSRELAARGYYVARYSQRGVPESPFGTEGPFTLDQSIEDLDVVRKQLGFERPVLLGHSWGGGLAIAYALRHPTHLSRLVLVTPIAIYRGWHEEYCEKIRSRLSAEGTERFNLLSRLIETESDPDRLNELALNRYREMWPAMFYGPPREFMLQRKNGFAFRSLAIDFDRWTKTLSIPDNFKCLKMPVTIVYSERDPVPEKGVRTLLDAIPQAELKVISKSAHFPWLENPSDFYQAIAPSSRVRVTAQ